MNKRLIKIANESFKRVFKENKGNFEILKDKFDENMSIFGDSLDEKTKKYWYDKLGLA